MYEIHANLLFSFKKNVVLTLYITRFLGWPSSRNRATIIMKQATDLPGKYGIATQDRLS